MPRRQLPGGVSPYATRLRPSLFNRLPPQEVIDRLGESVLWLRMMPTPYTNPGLLAVPDDPGSDSKGWIRTYEKSIQIETEFVHPFWRSGRRIYTQFCPIERIDRALVYLRDDYGGSKDLTIVETGENYFEVAEDVPDYYQIQIFYRAKTFVTQKVEIEQSADARFLNFDDHPDLIRDVNGDIRNVVVKIRELRRLNTTTGLYDDILDGCISHDFQRIYFPEIWPAGTKYVAVVDIYDSFKVSYRTMTNRDEKMGALDFEVGDMEVVTSPYMRISEGDSVTFLRTVRTAKESIEASPDGRFRASSGPISEIKQLHAITPSGLVELDPLREPVVEQFQYIRLPDNADVRRISVLYDHFPQYRAKRQVEASGLQNELQTPIWHFTPDNTSVLL